MKKVGILLEIAISSSVTAYTRVSGLSRLKFACCASGCNALFVLDRLLGGFHVSPLMAPGWSNFWVPRPKRFGGWAGRAGRSALCLSRLYPGTVPMDGEKKLDKLKHACYSESDHGDDRFRQGRVGTDCKPRSLTSLNRAKTLSAKKVPAFNAPSYNALPLAA